MHQFYVVLQKKMLQIYALLHTWTVYFDCSNANALAKDGSNTRQAMARNGITCTWRLLRRTFQKTTSSYISWIQKNWNRFVPFNSQNSSKGPKCRYCFLPIETARKEIFLLFFFSLSKIFRGKKDNSRGQIWILHQRQIAPEWEDDYYCTFFALCVLLVQ